jgi:hypothetical protein
MHQRQPDALLALLEQDCRLKQPNWGLADADAVLRGGATVRALLVSQPVPFMVKQSEREVRVIN